MSRFGFPVCSGAVPTKLGTGDRFWLRAGSRWICLRGRLVRGPRLEVHSLLVYVDDATSRLMELRFVMSESGFDCFAATESYLENHGKPVAL